MKVFVAGATGAVGRRLVPMLLESQHDVIAMTRSRNKVAILAREGSTPVVADALDAREVARAVTEARPDVIIHELTAIPPALDFRKIGKQFELTNRLRTEGTDNLLAAARIAGVHRVIAQSYAGWPFARIGGAVKTEEDPLDDCPPPAMREILRAIRHVETVVPREPNIEGIVLRYGALYGPGNTLGEGGEMLKQVRQRRVPIVGGGTAVWSFVHVDDAARATVAALGNGSPGVYNIVDNEPAPVSVWLPVLAQSVGAKPPRHLPAWIGRLAVGAAGMVMMTESRGASNEKARRELGWQPAWPSWREGFLRGLSDPEGAVQAA